MGNKTSMHRKVAALALAAIYASSAFAEIRFEERGKRFSVDVRDEPIAEVMDSLAEKFDFDVDGYPEHWSDEPMNFSATGDLERVLRSLLKDTSHVFEYHTDLDTRETRIAALKLLNEGVAGFVANQPQSPESNLVPDSPATQGVTRGNGTRQPGRLADRTNGLDGDIATNGAGSAANNSAQPNAQASSAPVSGLSASLAARARQSSNTLTQGANPSATAPAAPVDPSAPNADMQALTQKALQDVKGLAEALRNAEGK